MVSLDPQRNSDLASARLKQIRLKNSSPVTLQKLADSWNLGEQAGLPLRKQMNPSFKKKKKKPRGLVRGKAAGSVELQGGCER